MYKYQRLNIGSLPNPSVIMRLYSRYYSNDVTPGGMYSSVWKDVCSRLNVHIDNNDTLTSFEGYGYGDLYPAHFVNRILKCLCNSTYFVRLRDKKNLLFLARRATPLLRSINSYLSYDCFRQIGALSVIRRHLNVEERESFNVLMVGDGYGFLSALIKDIYPNATITLVDLGKSLFFQAVTLQRIYPVRSHSLLDDIKGGDKVDFLYVPAEDIWNLNGLTYKLFVNIHSMGEMTYKTINNYFDFFRTHSTEDNLFYCCNRKEREHLPGDEIIEFSKYPYLEGDRHLVDKICPFCRYSFIVKFPFIQKYDGAFIHRLSNLKPVTTAEVKGVKNE